ncbi:MULTISPECIES: IS1380 family transposase [unclassified Streptomyces]|uniref:IS1380 family transposase n=1 Tax=unclassified Streptomyces TaxID=2593676 RepID=UPI00225558C9|nr:MULTISPECIES: IS1380 family transposase [unclassified Streptomyces]MCX4406102.1 IS1380 family transposase [Streptomyces sp. NBC_01764]MCX5189373.1 IS1380 family transposase [Streptomyces sp. NBC_00268]
MKTTRWDHRLGVRADDRNLVGYAGVVLLRRIADRTGLTMALARALPRGTGPGWRDRGEALVMLACAIVLGATNVLEAEQLQYHWRRLFPQPVSDSTLRRALAAIDTPVAARVERARAAIRHVVWTLLALRPGGFPWIAICARELTGWYVLDLDATIVTCASRKEGAAGTFKGSFGHMPLGAWVANTRECVAMLLRPGNAPPNDVADHKTVLTAALRQLPLPLWSKLLIRIDGAAFNHDVLDHLQTLTTSRRRVRWVTGWAINDIDEAAIALLPEEVWTPALRQDGQLHEIKGPDGEWLCYQVAELTGLRDLVGWPEGMRLIARRVKPSRRDAKKLTAFEKRTGWRYQIIATNIPAHQGLSGVPGSGQVWFLDALYRDHAEVEDRVKAIKRVGLGLLPSKSWQLNTAWVLAATIAADLDAWTRLLLLHDAPALTAAEPETIRTKLYHLPARLTAHARRRTLHLDRTWPWAAAFTTAWRRLGALPAAP